MEQKLNYAFIHPAGGSPLILPLTIPKASLEAPIADLRSSIVQKLEADGVAVKLAEIQFWQSRTPLESRTAVNGWDGWFQEAVRDGQQAFIGIPLTDSVQSSVGERISDERYVHLIVTGGATPLVTQPGAPDITLRLPVIKPGYRIVVGRFTLDYLCPGRKNINDVGEGDRHSRDIAIPQSDDAAISSINPTVLLGVSQLDIKACASEMELLSYASDVCSEGFRLHFDTFGRTLLYYGALNWMAISPRHLSPSSSNTNLQWGTADTQSSYARKWGCRYFKLRVRFRKPFEQAPNVFHCLSGFTVGGFWCKHWDIRTIANSIDREGFTLHVEKTRDSEKNLRDIVAAAQITWVAFPGTKQEGQQLSCGEFHLVDGVRTERDNGKTVEWRGHYRFTQEFASPPHVFAAFTSFDVDKTSTVRLILDIEATTREGIQWKVKTFRGTIVYSATISFLAVASF